MKDPWQQNLWRFTLQNLPRITQARTKAEEGQSKHLYPWPEDRHILFHCQALNLLGFKDHFSAAKGLTLLPHLHLAVAVNNYSSLRESSRQVQH